MTHEAIQAELDERFGYEPGFAAISTALLGQARPRRGLEGSQETASGLARQPDTLRAIDSTTRFQARRGPTGLVDARSTFLLSSLKSFVLNR